MRIIIPMILLVVTVVLVLGDPEAFFGRLNAPAVSSTPVITAYDYADQYALCD